MHLRRGEEVDEKVEEEEQEVEEENRTAHLFDVPTVITCKKASK